MLMLRLFLREGNSGVGILFLATSEKCLSRGSRCLVLGESKKGRVVICGFKWYMVCSFTSDKRFLVLMLR